MFYFCLFFFFLKLIYYCWYSFVVFRFGSVAVLPAFRLTNAKELAFTFVSVSMLAEDSPSNQSPLLATNHRRSDAHADFAHGISDNRQPEKTPRTRIYELASVV